MPAGAGGMHSMIPKRGFPGFGEDQSQTIKRRGRAWADTVMAGAPHRRRNRLRDALLTSSAARGLHQALRRRSTIAFLMCLPLILIIACLVIYPALYSIYLSMLNKAQTRFIGLGNFSFLLSRDVFWMVVQ